MAAEISCPQVLAQEHCEVVVLKFPKSLWRRCEEFWTLCGQLQFRAWELFLAGCRKLHMGCRAFWVLLAIVIGALALLAFVSMAYWWIPVIMEQCHREPGIELRNFSIRDMAPFQSVSSAEHADSPWLVNSALNATFSTWNTNTDKMVHHSSYRVEYHGQIILQQQIPLGFSLNPRASRPFSIEMKGDEIQLKNDLGPVMQTHLRSDNITLNFFFNTRYLIADRRSKWESSGCVVVAKPPLDSSHLGTMLK